jgi:hypothetical protein
MNSNKVDSLFIELTEEELESYQGGNLLSGAVGSFFDSAISNNVTGSLGGTALVVNNMIDAAQQAGNILIDAAQFNTSGTVTGITDVYGNTTQPL